VTNKQTIAWTLLPRGLSSDGTQFLFSALVTPRLMSSVSPPTLSLFPDWTDWPSTVASATFTLQPSGAPATVVSAEPNSAAWRAMFPTATPVESFTWQSFAGRRVWSYPAGSVRDYLVSAYTNVLTQFPTSEPANKSLVDYVGPSVQSPVAAGIIGTVAFGQRFASSPGNNPPDTEDQAVADVEAAMAAPNYAVPPGYTWPVNARGRYETLQAKLFHQTRTPVPAGTAYSDLTPPPVPSFDFHQAVSFVSDHPALQRLFGLVVDLQAPVGTWAATGFWYLGVSWTPALGASATKQAFPNSLTDSSFLPAPRTSSSVVKGGALQLQTSKFSVQEFDVDGASQKVLATARTLWNRAQGYLASPGIPQTSTVPSLRGGGIGVSWSGLASQLAKASGGTFTFQDQLNHAVSTTPVKSITLGSEDVTRGWRVDVYDTGSGRWYQLCARQAGASGGFLIGSPPGSPYPVPAGDEGFVQLAPTGDASGSSSDLWLQETIFRWNGWSLIAPRPGMQLAQDPQAPDPLASDPGNPAATNIPISITYAVPPGTLARLRYGHAYRFRARAVDLAGNSLPFDSSGTAASLAVATKPVTYRRVEPVLPPHLLDHDPLTPGESTEILVIRSNYDIPDSSVVPTQRHLAPPPMSVLMAEEHGLLDASTGLPNPSTYSMLAARDGQNFSGGSADPNARGQLYYPTDDVGVPYLPDVLARKAALNGLPGTAGSTAATLISFASTAGPWPNARSFRLKLTAGSAAPVPPSTADGSALTVSLPKGTQATVTLSSAMASADLALVALWEWAPPSFRTSANKALATQGQIWMLSPNRTLLFVHAVRQPNTAPGLSADFAATRLNPGDTTAAVTGSAAVDSASTDRVDVLADWKEPVDDGTNADPVMPQPFSADLGHVDAPDDASNSVVLGAAGTPLVQHFGDTKRHDVSYQAVATTRYAKYFNETAAVALNGTTPTSLPGLLGFGVAPGTVAVVDPSGSPTYTEGTDYSVDYPNGTVARIATGSIPDGATESVTYVPAPVTRSSLENEPGGRLITIPSSANPIKPSVRSVLPGWSFDTSSSTGSESSSRQGGLVRVYLDRPWWSSGPEEVLGVVLNIDSGDVTTGYGSDPAHPTGSMAEATRSDFPLATIFPSTALELPGGTGPIDVAGHDVSFDSDRNLWFCDILINPLAQQYFPWVQLVLCRYQPGSLGGNELSPSVVLDMAQAVPNRLVVATTSGINPSTTSSVPVQVAGPIATGPYGLQNIVQAVVQQQSGGTDEVNWVNTAAPVALKLTSGTSSSGTWKGAVQRPAGSGPFRLLVTESERYYPGPNPATPTSPGGRIATRLVYADQLPL
jgi:hypothetical protein